MQSFPAKSGQMKLEPNIRLKHPNPMQSAISSYSVPLKSMRPKQPMEKLSGLRSALSGQNTSPRMRTARDPEIHQARKGKRSYIGLKCLA
jgi:hypothetical protein